LGCGGAIFVFGALTANGRVLVVDQRGGGEFTTIAEAVAEVRPGDTIQLVPGSGPYREELRIPISGRAGQPITFDGGGEAISGADPIPFVRDVSGKWVADLASFHARWKERRGFELENGRWILKPVPEALPFALIYEGARVWQDVQTGALIDYATLREGQDRLELNPGVDPKKWEISIRQSVVVIHDVSYHTYRNLIAEGSLNDGINLHGVGRELVFENVTGRNNFDEGFSAHDSINCRIQGGAFWGNDNGIVNVHDSVCFARDLTVYDNAGYGIYVKEGKGAFEDCLSRNNGVVQFRLRQGAKITVNRFQVVEPETEEKPWISYQESATRLDRRTVEYSRDAQLMGEVDLQVIRRGPAS
jgi:hypothetical protein